MNKKNISFFSFTKSKIVLFIILTILSLLYAFSVYSNIYLHGYSPSFLYEVIFWPALFVSSILPAINGQNIGFLGFILIFLVLAIEILYLYSLSCILVWIYTKLKK